MIGRVPSNAAGFDGALANVGNAQPCSSTSRRNLKSEIRNDQGRNCQLRLPLDDCALFGWIALGFNALMQPSRYANRGNTSK
jgi:hypothetical protein